MCFFIEPFSTSLSQLEPAAAVPKCLSVQQRMQLAQELWYHGPITRKQAEDLLKQVLITLAYTVYIVIHFIVNIVIIYSFYDGYASPVSCSHRGIRAHSCYNSYPSVRYRTESVPGVCSSVRVTVPG